MSRGEFSDYQPSQPFTKAMFEAMRDVAFRVDGHLGITKEGMVVIYGRELDYQAVAKAGMLNEDDFPYGYVIPGTDSIIVFEV
jgi:hypothetical protein